MTNAVIECILSRSAAKYYDPAVTLSDDQIRELVRIGTTAPTSFHMQNWRFIAVRSRPCSITGTVTSYIERDILRSIIRFSRAGRRSTLIGCNSFPPPRLDNEVDRQAVGGPRFGRPDDGHQCSYCGPLPDVAADDIENQIDSADVFQSVVIEVEELLRAEVERLLTVGGAPGADDVGAGLSCELRHHRSDCAGRAVREDALARLKAAVLEQPLPRGEPGDRQARAHPP
jgi:nitroreductase